MKGPHHAYRSGIVLALIAGAITLAVAPGSAHKPITSPFTYNDDVFPVLREKCGQCHVEGGVGPMSLMTHQDTVPWGESIRVELLAGHMPPWNIDASTSRFRNVQTLTAREMNVLLTWATGGTPFGNPEKAPEPLTVKNEWALGPPDLQIPLPNEFTLGADVQEQTAEFVIPTGLSEPRWIRAADLRPGTPAIVRSATIRVRSPTTSAIGVEPVLAVWTPADNTVALDGRAAFELMAGSELVVRVHYKKTWQYERREMRDRSTVGLYFAAGAPAPVRALTLTPSTSGDAMPGRVLLTGTIDERVQALAIYPGEGLVDAGVVVTAIEPGGARTELLAFHPRAGWARRFWFSEPIALAPGTRIQATITPGEESPDLPLGAPATRARSDGFDAGITLNFK